MTLVTTTIARTGPRRRPLLLNLSPVEDFLHRSSPPTKNGSCRNIGIPNSFPLFSTIPIGFLSILTTSNTLQPGADQGRSSTTAIEIVGGSCSKTYTRWSLDLIRAFISACETAIVEGHWKGQCFTKHGWKRVSALFSFVTGYSWSKQQLRNYWDGMRRTHKRLLEFVNNNGVEYDVAIGLIIVSDEWWNWKLKITSHTFAVSAYPPIYEELCKFCHFTLLHNCCEQQNLPFSFIIWNHLESIETN